MIIIIAYGIFDLECIGVSTTSVWYQDMYSISSLQPARSRCRVRRHLSVLVLKKHSSQGYRDGNENT